MMAVQTKSKSDGYQRNIGIYNIKTEETIFFQWVPSEINYSPDSDFAAIASPSRNNPFYHFTGSEDTITFELSWLAITATREDVIKNCRALEALTKNNGDEEGVNPVLFLWGNSVFDTAKNTEAYLVTAAPYTLSNFHAPAGMLPTYAKQQITLKRITNNNRTTEEILQIPISNSYQDPLESELPFLKYSTDLPDVKGANEKKFNTSKLDIKQKIDGIQLDRAQNKKIGEPSYFKNDKYARRRFLSEKGLALAKSAANNILNNTIFGVTQKASSTLSKIESIPNNKALSNIIPIPDYLK